MGTSFQYHRLPTICLLFFLYLQACGPGNNLSEKQLSGKTAEISNSKVILDGTPTAETIDQRLFQDSAGFRNAEMVKAIYALNNDQLLWSMNGRLRPEADSLQKMIGGALAFGLFPSDYYQQQIKALRKELQRSDSLHTAVDLAKWSSLDMFSTAAFVQFIRDVKFGRLLPDSMINKDTAMTPAFFLEQKNLLARQSTTVFLEPFEPAITDYRELKLALKQFLPKANLKKFSIIKTKDSLLLPQLVYKRITEEDSLKLKPVKDADSTTISKAVAKYQKWKKLKADGKISAALVKRLNDVDLEKFLRIAITLDRYKLLPPLPEEYLWVNLPAYMMELRHGDSVLLKSKIICGKPETRTPLLTSAITDMITYPQWTIPESIIKKEVLPGLQRDAGYINRKGFSLVDNRGNEVNPYKVKWAKYKNVIPYKVVQGSGDANALGVMKFNFSNPFAVYLHDTNQRYLFSKSSRALSHGCVRVQQWKELAYYLLRKDKQLDSLKAVPVDSLDSWLAKKKKKYIKLQEQLPLYIRYFSIEGHNGKLVVHDDIYEEDKRIRERVFASK